MTLTKHVKEYLDAEKKLIQATAAKREWERSQYKAKKERDAAFDKAFGKLLYK